MHGSSDAASTTPSEIFDNQTAIDMIAAGEAWQQQLVEKLTRSAIYRDYVRAFSETTGMPLALRAVEHWQPAMGVAANENRPSTLTHFNRIFCKIVGPVPTNCQRSSAGRK